MSIPFGRDSISHSISLLSLKESNYRTELIDFDVAHIRLPYNAILGYPALAS